jgi:hypothetical protein
MSRGQRRRGRPTLAGLGRWTCGLRIFGYTPGAALSTNVLASNVQSPSGRVAIISVHGTTVARNYHLRDDRVNGAGPAMVPEPRNQPLTTAHQPGNRRMMSRVVNGAGAGYKTASGHSPSLDGGFGFSCALSNCLSCATGSCFHHACLFLTCRSRHGGPCLGRS